ncbi:MAG: preprotein translocase subunit YajC [Acidimicrobiia bacterium]
MLLTTIAGIVLAAETDSSSGGSAVGFLLPLVVLGGLFYMLLIKPQRRRQKAMDELREAMEIGDEIRTVGGIYGRVTNITDGDIVIDIGGGTTLRVARRAVAERLGEDAG